MANTEETKPKISLGKPKAANGSGGEESKPKINLGALKKATAEEKAPEGKKKVKEKPKKKKKKLLTNGHANGVKAKNGKPEFVRTRSGRKKKVLSYGPSGNPRTNNYLLPKPKKTTPDKMDWQLERLRERKLVSPKVKTLVGVKLIKRYNDKKWVVKGTKKGWLVKNTGKFYTSLFGVTCNIVNGPRSGYQFFEEQLKKLGKKPATA